MKITLARGYVRAKKKALPPSRGESKRGTITKFSRASAVRLSSFLAELVIDGLAVHATFTYPKVFPVCQATIENHRHRMCKYLMRERFFGIWKKEYQKRGAVHYHVILWHKDGYEPDIHAEKIESIWRNIIASDSPYAVKLTAGDASLATFYLALHHGKRDEQSKSGSGRWWGYIDRTELIKYRKVESLELDETQQIWLARIFRKRMQTRYRYLLSQGKDVRYLHDKGLSRGFTYFLGQVDKYKLLRYLTNFEFDITGSYCLSEWYQNNTKIIDSPITREMLVLP